MTPDLKNLISDRYLSWTESWGLTLTYAITQSTEKSEELMAEAIVALIATKNSEKLPISSYAVRFAAMLWELGQRDAYRYRGFESETFFKMPAIARAVVILKVRAKLSRTQIAAALHLSVKAVEDHLENARLLFSSGRPWIETTVGCQSITQVGSHTYELQDIFAQYVGNDLNFETSQNFYSHLSECNSCRSRFSVFKTQYIGWVQSIPIINPEPELRKYLSHVTQMAVKVKARQGPSLWPGVRKILEKPKSWIWFFGFVMLAIAFHYLKRI